MLHELLRIFFPFTYDATMGLYNIEVQVFCEWPTSSFVASFFCISVCMSFSHRNAACDESLLWLPLPVEVFSPLPENGGDLLNCLVLCTNCAVPSETPYLLLYTFFCATECLQFR